MNITFVSITDNTREDSGYVWTTERHQPACTRAAIKVTDCLEQRAEATITEMSDTADVGR